MLRRKKKADLAAMIGELEYLYRTSFLSGYGSALCEEGVPPDVAQARCVAFAEKLREDSVLNIKTVFTILGRETPAGVLMPIEEAVV